MIKHYKDLYRKKARHSDIINENNTELIKNASILINQLNPKNIGLYYNLKHEVNILSLIEINSEINFCFPKIINEEVEFYLFNKESNFKKNPKYNFFEPNSTTQTIPDLIFVPGLMFDVKGYRLGFGKGYYDKYFANKVKLGYNQTLIGVCNSKNLTIEIPNENHDIKMHYILFNKNILKL
jgi:5-formyltetrahydrofolate cyclo-ligase